MATDADDLDVDAVCDLISARAIMKAAPDKYRAQNCHAQADNIIFLERYKSLIKWKKSRDRTIDLGCGDGSMTRVLEKYLPPNYETLIGCDLSPSMVKFANENYASDRVKFHQMDLEGDVPGEWREGFDHAFSFFVLNWVHNLEKAFANILELMAPGGDCLLVFATRHPVYDVVLHLSATPKWAPHLRDVDKFLSPYYYCQEPDEKVLDMMKAIGFRDVDVKSKQMIGDFTVESFTNLLLVVNPFDIPNELSEEFLADMEAALRGLQLVQPKEDGAEKMKCLYNLLVVHAAK